MYIGKIIVYAESLPPPHMTENCKTSLPLQLKPLIPAVEKEYYANILQISGSLLVRHIGCVGVLLLLVKSGSLLVRHIGCVGVLLLLVKSGSLLVRHIGCVGVLLLLVKSGSLLVRHIVCVGVLLVS